ncbi:hypothetical protein N7465_010115 [Penicillium sp. CMV-2018d]|nr:hypothetical protein N7465_010115 [Penicillium sp. CMV-2018d]
MGEEDPLRRPNRRRVTVIRDLTRQFQDVYRQQAGTLGRLQTGLGVVIYHTKENYQHKDPTKPSPAAATEPIMFLNRLLTPAEKNYWATELEVSCITWTIKKVRHLIETAKKPVIFYTDHSATIAVATSLKTSSTERLNLRLVRASMYMQQFPIKVFHRPRKTSRIADALSRLPSVSPTLPKQDDDLEALTGQVLIADPLNSR